MKNIFILFVFILLATISPAQNLDCEKVANYNIRVNYNADTHIISGTLQLNWTNKTSNVTSDLYFHAFLNAFKNSKSSFWQERLKLVESSASMLAGFEEEAWGYCNIKSILLDNGEQSIDLHPSLRFVQPDDGNESDQTVFKVDLPSPVAPGQAIQITIEFDSRLPRQAPRTGFTGDYVFAGQWFPKIGVLEEDGWNCHQFHALSEFYADYGDYDVSLTLPDAYLVGATGIKTDSTQNPDGTVTHRFQETCVHDFAWTASPDYKRTFKEFEHPELPNVRMELLYQPAHEKYVDNYFDAAANTLKYLGLWYTPYPYAEITVIDPAWRSKTGGMEYPTLFTGGVDWLTADGRQSPEGITVHECSHQFFHSLLGSNEFEDAWLDEGFATYATARCMNTAYGPGAYHKEYLEREGFGVPLTFDAIPMQHHDWIVEDTRRKSGRDPMGKLSWEFVDYASYRVNSYSKPAIALMTLENLVGVQVFADIMKAYAERFRFKHPTPDDFISIVNEFAPQPMDWFFDELMTKSGNVDYAVKSVTSVPVAPVKGLFDDGEKTAFQENEATNLYRSEVQVKRLGELHMPVQVVMTFEDGNSVTEEWDGKDGLVIFRYEEERRLLKAEIDPERKILLDIDPANNGKYRESNTFAVFRWTFKWLYWMQHTLETAAFF